MTNIIIRSAKIEDIDKIVNVHHMSAINAYKKLCPEEINQKVFGKEALYKDWYKYIKEAEENKNIAHFIASDEKGNILGILRANIAGDTEENIFNEIGFEKNKTIDKYAHLKNIYISPECQSNGVGKKLIVEAAKWAKEKNCLNMITMTLDQYEKSPAFFKKVAGATKIGNCESDVSAMYKNLQKGSVVLKFNVFNMTSLDYIIHRNSEKNNGITLPTHLLITKIGMARKQNG